jgi:hypothetical protein
LARRAGALKIRQINSTILEVPDAPWSYTYYSQMLAGPCLQPFLDVDIENLMKNLTKNYRVLNYNNHIFQPPVADRLHVVLYIWAIQNSSYKRRKYFHVRTIPLLSKFHTYPKNDLEN